MDLIFKKLDKEDCKKLIPRLSKIGIDLEWENWVEDNYLMDLPCKWDLSFTCSLNDEIVGYVFLSKKLENQIYIHRFIIDKNYRHKGIGKKILEQIQKEAIDNINILSLRVNENNIEAQNFYKKNGFSIEDILDGDYVLSKNIN